MSKSEQEIEVKFYVRDLASVARRVEAAGARKTIERVREVNLRFDTPDGALTRKRQVLRLRQDFNAVMTFKGPAQPGEEVSNRQEIEFQLSDFTAAWHLLEALGYQVAVIYEKYRTTYQLDDLTIVLDEMPFGFFVEIEGPDANSIRTAAEKMGFNWEARSAASYLALFSFLKDNKQLKAEHLTFDALTGVPVSPSDLGLQFAD